MRSGTVPSLVKLKSGGVAVAFQADTGNLWLQKNGVATDLRLGMAGNTSPALATTGDDALAVAFQANTGNLWVHVNGFAFDTRLGMKAGTSPSIAVDSSGVFYIAFQANTGSLWLWKSNTSVGVDLQRGMAVDTSPSIITLTGNLPFIAFQANTGKLWFGGANSTRNSGVSMRPRTSPSVANLGFNAGTFTDDVGIAFQGDNTALWVLINNVRRGLTTLGMAPTASPSIVGTGSGYQVAFEANTNALWLDINGTATNQGLGMNTP